ncbi:MAG: type II secretion system F family protein, partial [Christensenellales bacterium]
MVYPITLMVMMVGILAIMMIFVVPTFRESLSQLDVEMPAITMTIFNISDFVVENWKLIFLAVVFVIFVIKLYSKTKSGRLVLDTIFMKIPLFKRYQVAKVTSKFSRGFGLLIASGMNIIDSMEVIERVLGNKFVEKRFRDAIEKVRKGVSLTDALSQMNVFPTMLIQMIAVGEKTASMSEVLLRSCDYFDNELEVSLNSITSLIQPALMLVMGVLIGVIFIAVYSPMIAVMEGIV